jgi:hypothetical protein
MMQQNEKILIGTTFGDACRHKVKLDLALKNSTDKCHNCKQLVWNTDLPVIIGWTTYKADGKQIREMIYHCRKCENDEIAFSLAEAEKKKNKIIKKKLKLKSAVVKIIKYEMPNESVKANMELCFNELKKLSGLKIKIEKIADSMEVEAEITKRLKIRAEFMFKYCFGPEANEFAKNEDKSSNVMKCCCGWEISKKSLGKHILTKKHNVALLDYLAKDIVEWNTMLRKEIL